MNNILFPVITLVGQKNVGKSTLFNRLTNTSAALISNDRLGCTRDRQYGYVQYNQHKLIIIDTGGFDEFSSTDIQNRINNQIILAIKEAHIVFFMVDGRFKESAIDYSIASCLRKLGKNVLLVVNKVDERVLHNDKYIIYEYYVLGIRNIIVISAIHGYGIDNLLDQTFLNMPKKLFNYNVGTVCHIKKNNPDYKNIKRQWLYDDINSIKVAVVGRPNSGKSTFINFILKTNRMVTSDIPGTTRDSIYIPVTYNNQKYILIDTAGVRKKNRIDNNTIEYFSVKKTLQSLRYAHITLVMIDSVEGIVDQDLSLLKLVSDNSKSLVIVMNKWDILVKTDLHKNIVRSILYNKIRFLDFVKIHFVSSLYGIGIISLFKSIVKIYDLSKQTLNTSRLTHIMNMALSKYPPPLICGTRISPKPKYVHVGGYNPITIVIHGTQVSQLPCEYKKYLKKCFYKALYVNGILIRVKFKDSVNPFINEA